MPCLNHLFLFALLLALLCSCAAPAPTVAPALSGGEGPTLTATFTPLLPSPSPNLTETLTAPTTPIETLTPTVITTTPCGGEMGADCAMERIVKRCAHESHSRDDHTPVVLESFETYRKLRDAGILVEGFIYLPISYDPSLRIDKGCFIVPDSKSGQIWFILSLVTHS